MAKKVICLFVTIVFCLGIFFKSNIISIFNKDVDSAYGVSSSNSIAVDVGMEVLENGGNAVDAAAAISYVLGVVEPYGSGIGGGGCMLIYLPDTEDYKFYNYREIAVKNLSAKESTVGVPGLVKGIEEIQSKHGELDISDLIQYSIDLSKNGFEMNQNLYNRLKDYSELEKFPEFYNSNGEPKEVGSNIIQLELAETLTQIQKEGSKAFYSGSIADKLIKEGYMTEQDLESYEVKEQTPIIGTFNGYDIVTAPPPFSGITLLQILNMVEYKDIPTYEENPSEYIDQMYKITNIAYASRLANISDPNFVDEDKDYQKLATKEYSEYLYNKNYIKYEDEIVESKDTTSFVVTDKNGMMVSCTNTLGELFGNQEYIGGFFLNNASANFNENDYSINYYEPGKQSRTFIAPAIITKGEDYIMGIGSPGGNVIPQALAQVINDNLRNNVDLQEAVEKSRFVFENNKEIYCEEEISSDIVGQIISSGNSYSLIYDESNLLYGSIHAIVKDKNEGILGASDSRRRGEYKVKY